MDFLGYIRKEVFQFALRLEGKHAGSVARERMLARMRTRLLYLRASRVDGIVENNDPACLWD